MEKVPWPMERVKSGLRSFVLEISCWTMFREQADQSRLTEINWDTNGEQSTFSHVGGSWHTQNVQINRVIGENKKRVFILWKNPYGLFGQPNTKHSIPVIAFTILVVSKLICAKQLGKF